MLTLLQIFLKMYHATFWHSWSAHVKCSPVTFGTCSKYSSTSNCKFWVGQLVTSFVLGIFTDRGRLLSLAKASYQQWCIAILCLLMLASSELLLSGCFVFSRGVSDWRVQVIVICCGSFSTDAYLVTRKLCFRLICWCFYLLSSLTASGSSHQVQLLLSCWIRPDHIGYKLYFCSVDSGMFCLGYCLVKCSSRN